MIPNKYIAETNFWQGTIQKLISWFNGELKLLYGTNSPLKNEKIIAQNVKDAAILTWHKLHQKVKYLADLQVHAEIFKNKRLLDIGAGPMPSATCFAGADLYCLDPLLGQYLKAGFPIHYYGDVKFVNGYAEQIPVADDFFDAIISVNALDHVDDFEKTALEIKRVLKEDGIVIFHLHYHRATITEPLALNDDRIIKAFPGVMKIFESNEKFGSTCPANEKYTLWGGMINV